MNSNTGNIVYQNDFDEYRAGNEICYVNVTQSALWKRHFMEIIFIILISPMLILLFLVISGLVILDFRGKIIFRQARAGKAGRPFTMYKFRTMKNMHCCINNYFVHQKERVTRLGSFLRRHRLDELPQLWNVIKGEMSIIGPRPEIYELYRIFSILIPDYQIRKSIPQGITGWSQVNMPHTVTIEGNVRKLEYDKYYIENLSAKLDLIIIIKTIKNMVTGNFAK